MASYMSGYWLVDSCMPNSCFKAGIEMVFAYGKEAGKRVAVFIDYLFCTTIKNGRYGKPYRSIGLDGCIGEPHTPIFNREVFRCK